jgi:hypothetical protein
MVCNHGASLRREKRKRTAAPAGAGDARRQRTDRYRDGSTPCQGRAVGHTYTTVDGQQAGESQRIGSWGSRGAIRKAARRALSRATERPRHNAPAWADPHARAWAYLSSRIAHARTPSQSQGSRLVQPALAHSAVLHEADVRRVLAEAAAADVEAVLADQAATGVADAAAKGESGGVAHVRRRSSQRPRCFRRARVRLREGRGRSYPHTAEVGPQSAAVASKRWVLFAGGRVPAARAGGVILRVGVVRVGHSEICADQVWRQHSSQTLPAGNVFGGVSRRWSRDGSDARTGCVLRVWAIATSPRPHE